MTDKKSQPETVQTLASMWPQQFQPASAAEALVQAYGNVFDRARPGVDLVLADLALLSGYYFTSPEGANLERAEGRREVFARILNLTALPMRQIEALRVAAVEEQQFAPRE